MNKRKSGILLHVTSLPGTPGIGTLGESAYKFADWLKNANQSYWQVLPLGPTGYGDSPYQSFSTFAGNPLLIDFDDLVKRGWASKDEVLPPDYIKSQGNVDFGSVVWWKMPVLAKCAAYFLKKCSEDDRVKYEAFKNDQSSWLNNYADYTSIKNFYDAKAKNEGVEGVASMWNRWWPRELAEHDASAVSRWDAEHTDDVEQIKVIQFFFDQQWSSLKNYVNSLGIKIIGDIPIFVAGDSADVWANQKFFQMDSETLLQKTCAGVPPDYFSATGQLWGNPLYDWDAMKKDNYSWWVDRIKNMLRLVDVIRIDHFRGFEAYWQIPYGAPNAIKGEWIKGPGKDLFDEIKKRLGTLPIIAEDLGVITPEVEELRDGCGFPGMKILQFAFNDEPWTEESEENKDLPGNYKTSNVIVYTGTHDNDTTAGFFASASEQLKENVATYFELDKDLSAKELTQILIEKAFSSKADTAVIPLQDVFALGSEARMNTPSTTGSNWTWRMESEMLCDTKAASCLKELSKRFKRNS
ncbi:MAG: 4-alpha-glucanotransferase [Treponema sp.]|nr:4-alpha-glucanotransferase [Treponema sp.]